jgi:hypothetical protein
MSTLTINSTPQVETVFGQYPVKARKKLLILRKLIIEVAKETEGIEQLEQTLKWGEPSYLTKHGSTIRVDWKANQPNQYAMYFKCTSKLVPTFKEVFGNTFNYEGNRAIAFSLEDDIPVLELKKCIAAALTYHKVKHLPLLGIM